MYFKPTGTQRQRIADLLATAPLSHHELLSIAIAAGLPAPQRPPSLASPW
jgi:hypothetical protein